MASLFEFILKPLSGIFNLLKNPIIMVMMIAIIGIAFAFFMLYQFQLKPKKKILYFSEAENQGIEMTVKRMTPALLYSKKGKDPYRFIRYREAFNFSIGLQTITRWLAKKGTAFTKRLESGEVGEFTLYRIMEAVWGKEIIDALKDKQKQKLIESEVMITVRLEEGFQPKGKKGEFKENITEIMIKNEEDAEQARTFGQNARKELFREDWIKTIGLVGTGVALCYVGQAMGLLGGIG